MFSSAIQKLKLCADTARTELLLNFTNFSALQSAPSAEEFYRDTTSSVRKKGSPSSDASAVTKVAVFAVAADEHLRQRRLHIFLEIALDRSRSVERIVKPRRRYKISPRR